MVVFAMAGIYLRVVAGGNKMGEYPAAVDTFPQEGIIGQFIKFAPADLGGHKIRHAAFLHNLGQSSRIAEHVRQPQGIVIFPEFPTEKLFSQQELTHQGFPRRQVAVGFQPHAAVNFPPAFRHPLLNLFIHLGGIFFYILVQLRLAGHKGIFRVPAHQFQHRRKTAHGFIPRNR